MTLPTATAITAAFRAGRTSPTTLARMVIDASRIARGRSPNVDPFIAIDEARALADAAASDARWRAGTPQSPFDGVPIGVKDHVDVAGYVTKCGTSWLARAPAAEDAPVVAQLRRAGAVVIGKLHQHELGLGATGINMHAAVPRNPHDVRRAPGGSSSGSAQAVAIGLVPVAVGADGGGSIRIPSSLCGVFGLKTTFGRMSRSAADLDGGTLAVLGPIASSVEDCAAFLRLTCDYDPRDLSMEGAPPLDLDALDRARAGEGRPLRIGVVEGELADADADVARAVEAALGHPAMKGQIEPVSIRVPSLPLARPIGYVTFGVEVAAAQRTNLRRHRAEMGYDIRLLLALGERLQGTHFLHAQKLRARLRREVDEALREVDLLALPSTACTAPLVRSSAEVTGEVDDATTTKLSRYTFMANLCGLPACSLPIGVDRQQLPVGLQLVGAAFDEATVLRAMYAFEREGVARCPEAKERRALAREVSPR